MAPRDRFSRRAFWAASVELHEAKMMGGSGIPIVL